MADFHEFFSPKLNHFLLYFKSFFYTLHVVKFTVSELYSVGEARPSVGMGLRRTFARPGLSSPYLTVLTI